MSIYKIKDYVPECDYPKIKNFLKNHWKENHALVLSKELLDFQHLDKKRGQYHFIIAENQLTGEIDSLSGYIPTWQYDESLITNGDYWGAIWKTRTDLENEEIGLAGTDVFVRLFKLPNFNSEAGIGLSEYAKKASKAFRYKLDYMHQFFILNNEIENFQIADCVMGSHKKPFSDELGEEKELSWIDIYDDSIKVDAIYRPYKSITYLINRYERHPIYKYRFLGVFGKNGIEAILVTRKIFVNNSSVIRIVDVLGALSGSIYYSVQKIIKEEQSEYIDMLNYGIEPRIIKQMGFQELNFDSPNIILPNYFEPFLRENVKLYIMYKAKFPYVAFKGDGDQDRPNIIDNEQ